MQKALLIVVLALASCGGGGGGSDEPKHCASDGFPLWCSAVGNYCCPPEHPYACRWQGGTLGGELFCYTGHGCPMGSDSVDYCEEE